MHGYGAVVNRIAQVVATEQWEFMRKSIWDFADTFFSGKPWQSHILAQAFVQWKLDPQATLGCSQYDFHMGVGTRLVAWCMTTMNKPTQYSGKPG